LHATVDHLTHNTTAWQTDIHRDGQMYHS